MEDLACKQTYKTVIFVILQPAKESHKLLVFNNTKRWNYNKIRNLSFNMMT